MTHMMIGFDEPPPGSGRMQIVAGFDDSAEARAAIATAAALFRGADAAIVSVMPAAGAVDVERSGVRDLDEAARELARELADEGTALASAAHLHAHAEPRTGARAWRELLAVADNADLLVCGTRGARLVERMVLGSTASSLIHHAHVPVLVAPAPADQLDGPVLIGWDGSDGAQGALEFAARHLRQRRLIVAHAWRSPVRHTLRGRVLLHSTNPLLHEPAHDLDEIFAAYARDAAEQGAEAARALGLDAEPRACESDDGEWHALLHAARELGAAAVLVGSRGRGGLPAAVLGSVASGLVHAGVLPVIVVP